MTSLTGKAIEKEVETVNWELEDTDRGGYDHFRLKEVHEQPQALRQCLQEHVDELSGVIDLGDDV